MLAAGPFVFVVNFFLLITDHCPLTTSSILSEYHISLISLRRRVKKILLS